MRNRSRRRSAFAWSVMSSIGIPAAAAALISDPMLVPANTEGLIPFSSSAASTPICANPLRPPPPRTRATFGRDSGVRLRRGLKSGCGIRSHEKWRGAQLYRCVALEATRQTPH